MHMSADTQMILHCHSVDTWPIPYRHSANTTLTWSALVSEFYLLHSTVKWPLRALWEGLSVAVVLSWSFIPATFIYLVFPAMFFLVITFIYDPHYFPSCFHSCWNAGITVATFIVWLTNEWRNEYMMKCRRKVITNQRWESYRSWQLKQCLLKTYCKLAVEV